MIPKWYPEHPAIYDIHKSYAENAVHGPFFNGTIPPRPASHHPIDLFGHKVNSSLGVPAGPLLNSRWIALAAKLGFDVLTYKTIRSFSHPGHAAPNIIYVSPNGSDKATWIEKPPAEIDQLTITNSFGMPSRPPDFLLEDIGKANASLSKGQVMIVSIVGTPLHRDKSYLEDFVQTASLAREAGAKIIEANLSCPNVDTAEGLIYMNPETVYEYVRKIVSAINPIPLVIKVGKFANKESLKSVFLAAARGGANGICGLNSISMRIVGPNDSPALEKTRKTSGVCGGAIRNEALHFVHEAADVIRENKLDLLLLGCGGIMLPQHFDEFLHAGAKVAMSATGMMWDPYLALRYHETKHLSN